MRPHVIIIGGGFGLYAARALRVPDADVTVIDRTNHHVFQPLLYQGRDGHAHAERHRPAHSLAAAVATQHRSAAERGDVDRA